MTDPTCYHDGGTCRLQDALDEARERGAALEATAWADYQACAAERDAALARVDSLTATLEHARQALLAAQEQQQRDAAEIAEHAILDAEIEQGARFAIATGTVALHRVAELEALIAKHEHTVQTDSRGKLCPECACAKDDGWRPQLPPHTSGCPWGQAAANHRARVACSACNGTRRIADVVCPECDPLSDGSNYAHGGIGRTPGVGE